MEHLSPQPASGWQVRWRVDRSIRQQPEAQSLLYEQISPKIRSIYLCC